MANSKIIVIFTKEEQMNYQTTEMIITDEIRAYLIEMAVNAAVKAGAEIMKIYKNHDDYDISVKNDRTPITVADRLAHSKIKEALGATRIPILSEEGREMLYEERQNWELFWLVDPLDGTVEFIKGNNEFTVNIALMQDNECVGSVVYVPYYHKMYIGERGHGAHLVTGIEPSSEASYHYTDFSASWRSLPLASDNRTAPRVALSRSHQTPETAEHVASLRKQHPDLEVVEQGSSYKFCMLAEGTVDYYVRTSQTYEWDTAAGELILAETGGSTRNLEDGSTFRYNKEDLRNPWFECYAADSRIR